MKQGIRCSWACAASFIAPLASASTDRPATKPSGDVVYEKRIAADSTLVVTMKAIDVSAYQKSAAEGRRAELPAGATFVKPYRAERYTFQIVGGGRVKSVGSKDHVYDEFSQGGDDELKILDAQVEANALFFVAVMRKVAVLAVAATAEAERPEAPLRLMMFDRLVGPTGSRLVNITSARFQGRAENGTLTVNLVDDADRFVHRTLTYALRWWDGAPDFVLFKAEAPDLQRK